MPDAPSILGNGATTVVADRFVDGIGGPYEYVVPVASPTTSHCPDRRTEPHRMPYAGNPSHHPLMSPSGRRPANTFALASQASTRTSSPAKIP